MKLTAIHTGSFKLDGGAMFGIVPRRMWMSLNPPDEQNMCTWAMRALLVQTGSRTILIDTGIGNKQDDKFRMHFEPHGPESLFGSLARAGVGREDVTDVFLTHLHFDHCGGALWRDEDTNEVTPAFPNAVYWSNKRHFDWAMNPNQREKASFLQENFLPLFKDGRLRFLNVKQGIRFLPDINIRFFYGHTEAMMAPLIRTPGGTLLYCADAMPSQWHIGMPYIMAYDVRPLQTLKEKEKMLQTAALKKQVLFFEHDPVAACGTVKVEGGRIVLDKTGNIDQLLT